MTFRYVIYLLFQLSICCLGAQNVVESHDLNEVNATPNVRYVVDAKAEMNLGELLQGQKDWQMSPEVMPNLGMQKGAIWVHFRLKKTHDETIYLNLPNSVLTTAWLYTVKNGVLKDSVLFGVKLCNDKKDLSVIAPTVRLRVEQDQVYDFYVRLHGVETHIIDFHVSGQKYIYDLDQEKSRAFYCFVGVMFCVMIYGLFFKLSESSSTNIIFLFYCLFLLLVIGMINGFHIQMFLPYMVDHHNLYSSVLMVFMAFCVSILTDLKKNALWLYYLRYLMIGLAALGAIFNVLEFNIIANLIIINTAFLGAVLGAILGVVLTIKKQRGALVFFAFGGFIIGFVIYLLSVQGFIEQSYFVTNAPIWGSVLQVMLLFIYFNRELRDLRKTRKNALEQVYTEVKKNNDFVKKQKEVLKEEVTIRTQELRESNTSIRLQHETMQASIKYASYIQQASLQDENGLKDIGIDGFVLYKPKDVLSGDFYFYTKIEEHVFVIAADCTGHGVPGALLSATGSSILRELIFVEKIKSPAVLLSRLNKEFYYTLRQGENNNKDGMDISCVVINKQTNTLHYAGAYNPLVYIKEGKLTVVKGDRNSIGGYSRELQFQEVVVEIGDGLQFFIYSDGYQDQFSGLTGKKIMSKKFRGSLLEISDKESIDQKEILEDGLNTWKGAEPQTDDVLVMGVKLDKQSYLEGSF